MILRPAGLSSALPVSHPPKLSRPAMTAIGLSLAFHAIVGVYLYEPRFTLMSLPAPDNVTIIMDRVHFPPPSPPEPPKQQPQRAEPQRQLNVHMGPQVIAG